jgi:hypothetical protein
VLKYGTSVPIYVLKYGTSVPIYVTVRRIITDWSEN